MKRTLSAIFATFASAGVALAGDSKQVIDTMVEADQSLCDLFDRATFYSDKENPVLQKLAMTGRLQADAAFFHGGDNDYEELNWRRARNGIKATVFENFTVHSEAEFDLIGQSPLYRRLTDANITWSHSDAFEFTIGKLGTKFTVDGKTSSKELVRIERHVLSENLWFPVNYFTGAAARGEIDKWVYTVGLFSGDAANEFSEFDSGIYGTVTIGYDFGEALGLDQALIAVDFVASDFKEDSPAFGARLHDQIGSINAILEKGPWGVRADLSAGSGHGSSQSEVFGLAITPYYSISEKVQLVASYNYVGSSGANGVRLDRYENRTVSGRVDEVHEFFAGVNYYICGHKLKWQNGVEYTTATDVANDGGAYDGWGFTSAVRISW